METMLHLLYRHYSLPPVCSLQPVQTVAPYLLYILLLLTSCADYCSLPPEQTTADPYLLSRLLLLTSCVDTTP
ncbi:hypothetical protein Tco_0599735 [Tanacetum coccineum]